MYTLFIYLLRAFYTVAAVFHPKAAALVRGRQNLLRHIREEMAGTTQSVLWVHAASLGEFEQGRPVIEAFRNRWPHWKIVLTFFSPSGYEVRKDYAGADHVFYLPWDTPHQANAFLDCVKPSLVFFIKYEYWQNMMRALATRQTPLLLVSAIFRRSQYWFRWYGASARGRLREVSHFFVQNEESQALLRSIGITACTVSGDTRFDRVSAIVRNAEPVPIAESFKSDEKVWVVGSCWPADWKVLRPFVEAQPHLKFIIAPHEISEAFLREIESGLTRNVMRYSKADIRVSEADVLLIDNIGLLSRLYRYGEYAWVGGAYGKGLHNILEAACYGMPVFFGNRAYQKFREAQELLLRGGAFAVADTDQLEQFYQQVSTPEQFMAACETTRSYVEENVGATDRIIRHCERLLTP